jgi:glucokinase
MMLLTGDIGGTKTDLALYSTERGPKVPIDQGTFRSGDYPSLEALAASFVRSAGHAPTHGTFGVPGPVVEGRAQVTNLPWVVEEAKLEEALGLRAVRLLNDLEAIANGIPALETEDVHVLHDVQPVQGGSKAVIAPGTGLGEGFLVWDGKRYRSCSSEGGHGTFAPMDERQLELSRFLMGRFGHVSNERVCSGLGIPNLYRYLKDTGFAPEPDWLALELEEASDPTPVILRAAADTGRTCELCRETLRLFVSIFGGEAGNMALKVMATGGVYLAGGIAPRIISALETGDFLKHFLHKGRLQILLEQVPVFVIMHPKIALLGSACYGLEMMGEEQQGR